jgi:hypothetical protein
MRQWKNGMQWITAALIAVPCFTFLHFFYPYHLYLKEQLILFQTTPDYFLSYFGKPAWLALFAGDFFTQFFYFKGGGPTVITIPCLYYGGFLFRHLNSSGLPDVGLLLHRRSLSFRNF